jgi:amino acid transporter
VRDPVRNLPRAILLALCLATVLYLVVALVAILSLCRPRNLPPVTLRSH